MVPACEPLVKFSDRLFFTTFPHPKPSPDSLNRIKFNADNAPPVRTRTKTSGAPASPDDFGTDFHWFCIDDTLVYLSFFEDWGPLNISQVFKACILIHELLQDKSISSHRLVLYSSNDPRRKANAALLMALYVMIVMRRAPWDAFYPIAELEFMPFRDAGRGRSDFNLNIQDCLWGMWKAMNNGLCNMNDFSVEEYEYYEKVENGDWNWITPNFIAFASPMDPAWVRRNAGNATSSSSSTKSSSSNTALQRKLPTPFLNCLEYFESHNIKLVVRLNNPLYDKAVFEERGIEHLELYFDDGTNPTDEIVREFIRRSDAIVEAGGVIAVHCKAGLGRTGTLIGAYLTYKYGFTANEAIAFMRIIRPGCVVGPQQQYMYLNQLHWSKWAAVDEMRKSETENVVMRPVTPPSDDATKAPPPVTPKASSSTETVAGPPPGQPRKTPAAKRPVQSDDEAEDTVAALPSAPPPRPASAAAISRGRVPNARPMRTARPPATEQVTRVLRPTTRSTAPSSASATSSARKAPTPSVTASASKPTGGYKIPRLAAPGTTVKPGVRRPVRPTSPSPSPSPVSTSRLPTLIPSKRSYTLKAPPPLPINKAPGTPSESNGVTVSATTPPSPSPDAWMSGSNANSVVIPGSKSERPLLRSVRRRRSSFSAADVMA